jgi:uncharacterized membrane protein YhhN
MSYLLLLIVLSGLLHITGLYVKSPSLKMVFKPLTTVLIIYLAFRQGGDVFPFYKTMILIGLGLSLVGDVFLMLPRERFVAGLVSFLLAHIFFIVAFTANGGPFWNWFYLAPVFVYFALLSNILLKHTGKMTLPVLVYSLVILFFVWQAAGRYDVQPTVSAAYGFYGAVLFALSDSLLAYNKFVKTLKAAPALVMVLYWGALYFIALSV